jgi:D-arginine dehydrogenase
MDRFDVVVIGAGIAGASAAYEIAQTDRVLLLERESQPGYHSSGRSVATFSETYGNPIVRALTVGSRDFYQKPPPGFCDHPLLSDRGVLTVARADQVAKIEGLVKTWSATDSTIHAIATKEALRRVPILREDYVAGAIWKPKVMDIDVHALLQGFLRGARNRGAQIRNDSEVLELKRVSSGWTVTTRSGEVQCRVVVNAAGAWADVVAAMAGVKPLGLKPLRRTAMTFAAPDGQDIAHWPMAVDLDEKFYFKVESGRLLASPCDETPMEPCDVRPDEIDVAQCIDRVQRAANISVQRIERSWAGLRSFVPDRTPAVGYDIDVEGFFWCAGQGGYGFQTAPAMGRVTASFLQGGPLPEDLIALGLSKQELLPDRLRKGVAAVAH